MRDKISCHRRTSLEINRYRTKSTKIHSTQSTIQPINLIHPVKYRQISAANLTGINHFLNPQSQIPNRFGLFAVAI